MRKAVMKETELPLKQHLVLARQRTDHTRLRYFGGLSLSWAKPAIPAALSDSEKAKILTAALSECYQSISTWRDITGRLEADKKSPLLFEAYVSLGELYSKRFKLWEQYNVLNNITDFLLDAKESPNNDFGKKCVMWLKRGIEITQKEVAYFSKAWRFKEKPELPSLREQSLANRMAWAYECRIQAYVSLSYYYMGSDDTRLSKAVGTKDKLGKAFNKSKFYQAIQST
jgi:hypothetical protein